MIWPQTIHTKITMENAKKEDVWIVTGEVIPKGDLEKRRVYGSIFRDFESAKNSFRGLIRRLSEEEEILGRFQKGFDSWGYDDDEYLEERANQFLAKSLTKEVLRGNDVSEEASNYLDLWGTNYMFSYEVSKEEEPVFQSVGGSMVFRSNHGKKRRDDIGAYLQNQQACNSYA